MKQIAAQIINGNLIPFDEQSKDDLAEFKPNQIVICKVSGTRKERSLTQLKTYWAACSMVSENTDHPKWNSRIKTDWQIRNRLLFYDHDLTLVINGYVTFKVRSISFRNLKHIEACNYFDRAFDLMASFLKTDRETFINEVKMRCGL
jgi:hypothetical protein